MPAASSGGMCYPTVVGVKRRFIRLWRILLVEDAACGAGLQGEVFPISVFI